MWNQTFSKRNNVLKKTTSKYGKEIDQNCAGNSEVQ